MPNRAKEGMPNVLFIVQDDTGFGQLGCYVSPIKTPNLDMLAMNGLLFNSMHTTALCSPTRSCIITGRNHHSNSKSCITEGPTGYPGGNGYIPFENGLLSEILLQNGMLIVKRYLQSRKNWALFPKMQSCRVMIPMYRIGINCPQVKKSFMLE